VYGRLKNAIEKPFTFEFDSESQRAIIEKILDKSFVEPNSYFKWRDEPVSWVLYIPPITIEELSLWS